ncbi:MAG: M6 family metalloprotease domain-containing protein [Firmicutes bacterium]|nr:M6 family metalloprotease domain-containing protein [Bacillota bacterium]
MLIKGWIGKRHRIFYTMVLLLAVLLAGVSPACSADSSVVQLSDTLQKPAYMPPQPGPYDFKIFGGINLAPTSFIPPKEMSVPADSTITSTTGKAKVLVIMIDFPASATSFTHTQDYWQTMLFDPNNPHSLTSYYRVMSYGKLTIEGGFAPQVSSDYLMSWYGEDGYVGKHDDFNGPIYNLTKEAVQKVAVTGFDFSPYDANPLDGIIDHLIIIHAGGGQEMYGAPSNYIWSHRWGIPNGQPAGSVWAYGYTMQPDDGQVGVFAHEFGHDLGLPDLYDRTLSSEGLGNWSLMAGGSWNGPTPNVHNGTNPAQMTAWEKIQLGWLTPVNINASKPIDLPTTSQPGNLNPVVYKLPLESNSDEYFLLENRQQVGFDSGLPGTGLLIYHVDDSVTTQNDNPQHSLVALEQADGQRDMENNINRGDAGDPYPGLSGNRNFTDVSTPNNHSYTGVIPTFKLINIGDSAPTMTADYITPVTPTGGGTVITRDGVKVEILAGAVLKDTIITVTPVNSPPPAPAHVKPLVNQKVWDLAPTGIRFNKPVTITLPYNLTGSDAKEDQLRIFYYDPYEATWLPVGGKVDTINKAVTADINHFSVYTVMESSLLVPASGNLISYLALTNNPFSPNGDGKKDNTIFKFALTRDARINIRIYDSQGNLVLPLVEGINQAAGLGSIVWDGTNNAGQTVGSGIYVFKIEATDGQGQTQAMTKPVAVVRPR